MNEKKKVVIFVSVTYIMFWCFLLIIGGIMTAGANDTVIEVLSTISAWAPTIVVCILFHRILPGEHSRIDYVKHMFKGKKISKMVLFMIVLQTVIFILSVWIVSLIENKSFTDYIDISVPIFFIMMIKTVLSGASGEELGWRGFLQPKMVNKFGVVKGSFVVGIIWGIWHWPLWVVSYGSNIKELLIYSLTFLVSIAAAAMVIGICYQKTQNLLVPMCIHFMFNFTATFYEGDRIILLAILAAFYLILAGAFSLKVSKKELSSCR